MFASWLAQESQAPFVGFGSRNSAKDTRWSPVSRRPTFSFKKERGTLSSSMFLPIISIESVSSGSEIGRMCFHVTIQRWERGLGALFIQRAFCALLRSWSMLHLPECLLFPLSVAPSMWDGGPRVYPFPLYSNLPTTKVSGTGGIDVLWDIRL